MRVFVTKPTLQYHKIVLQQSLRPQQLRSQNKTLIAQIKAFEPSSSYAILTIFLLVYFLKSTE
jgi:hypothetical protein